MPRGVQGIYPVRKLLTGSLEEDLDLFYKVAIDYLELAAFYLLLQEPVVQPEGVPDDLRVCGSVRALPDSHKPLMRLR